MVHAQLAWQLTYDDHSCLHEWPQQHKIFLYIVEAEIQYIVVSKLMCFPTYTYILFCRDLDKLEFEPYQVKFQEDEHLEWMGKKLSLHTPNALSPLPIQSKYRN